MTNNSSSKHRGVVRALMGAGTGAALLGSLFFVGIAYAQAPVISSITASPAESGATITWTTDQGANAQVLYGTSTPYTASTTPTTGFASTTQSVTLANLTPGTTYHYAVTSVNASGTAATSADQTFMTLAASSTATSTSSSTGMLSISPASGTTGSSFTLNGSGFGASEVVDIDLNGQNGGFNGALSPANSDASGNFSRTIVVPTSTTVNTSTLETVTATGASSGITASTTFTLNPAIPVASATIVLDPASGTPGTSFTVTGNAFSPSEGVTLDFLGATSSVSADAGGTFSASLAVPSSTVATGNTLVTAMGGTSGMTASAWFNIIPASTSTATSTSGSGSNSTSTSAVIMALESEITQLQSLLTQLNNEVQALLSGSNSGSGNGNSGNGNGNGSGNGSFPSSTLAATIDQIGSVRAGTSVDFTGRNWGTDERVRVTNNGTVVTTAQADDGGNFSTGSLPVSGTPGTQTYTFTGLTTGLTRTVTVDITQ